MIDRVRKMKLRLHMAISQVPMAADIINDGIGCKAKVREGIQYRNYTPPPDGGLYYYAIQSYEERRKMVHQVRPFEFFGVCGAYWM